jgi:carboxypeptidase Taq
MTAYQELERRYARVGKLRDAAGVLHWDMSVMMPPGGAEARAEQLATLEGLAHELQTDPALSDLLEEVSADGGDLDPWQAANLAEMRRQHIHATALSGDLVEAMSRAASRCEMIWREARPNGDFAVLLPSLGEVLSLTREAADIKAEKLGMSSYDALLDQYDPGRRSADIDRIFDDLESFLPDFLQRVIDHQAARPAVRPLKGYYPEAAQRALGVRLMQALGFDFSHGRLDISLHPFSSGVPEDVRITTRYDEEDFTTGLMAVLHETGHALYDRGLPAEWRHQPVGDAHGMAMHESQSLIIEMQACRSREFIDFVAPLMREAFGGSGRAWEPDNIHRLYTRVEPGLIRVDADEVTYPAHIILRYRLERALITGDLELADLPAAWGEGMQKLLGIAPPDDREGCLQDIHWPDGAWGYFPTYTLGAMTAAQLFEAARRSDPDMLPGIARGDFGPLMRWLGENVHAKASSLSMDTLLTEATGKALDAAVFKHHLEQRYLS